MRRHLKILPFVLIVSIFFSLLSSTSYAAVLKIIAVKDFSESVYINGIYTLPKVVAATMSDKTTQNLAVTWDKKIAVTSKTGTYVYKGTVKGYAKQVLLTLKVVPVPKPVVGSSPAPAPTYSDPELARAESLGIGKYAKNGPVSYKQFFQMLDAVASLAKPDVLPQWKKKFSAARVSNKTMRRDEGMLSAFYVANTLGSDYCTYNSDWTYLNNLIGESAWKDMSWDYKLFPDWDKPAKIGSDTWDNHMIAAYFYSMGRISLYNNATLFDFDSVKVSMRPAALLTYEEALRAALRLYDSCLKVTDRVPTKEDAAILQNADVRRNEILNTKTTVKITGTAYYVSNSGNDSNDGKTPQTAWATIDNVNRMMSSMSFNKGDGIFFERGGVYRGAPLLLYRTSITVSAYGEGPKPRIYGSPENGADPKKWTLLDGTKNIWVFYKDMYDTGGLVFNDGKSWATRKTAIWNGTRYVEVKSNTTPIDVKKLDNLQLFSAPDYTGYSTRDAISELDKTGKLYLRCDAGNPGEVYDSIEFLSQPPQVYKSVCGFIIQTGPNCVLDNLCIMYGNAGGVSLAGNSIAQNCEVAWVGGTIAAFNGAGLGTDMTAVIQSGDGILLAQGTNSSAINNYVHHSYDNGITVETGPWQTETDRFAKNMTIKGNLVEASSGGIMVSDWEATQSNTDRHIFENILIEDNYCMYSGYGWSHLVPEYNWGQIQPANNGNCNIYFAFPAKAGKAITVKNNVLYLSRYALVGGKNGRNGQKAQYPITFSGNTYVQHTFGLLLEYPPLEDFMYSKKHINNFNAKKTVADILGDKTGVVLEPK